MILNCTVYTACLLHPILYFALNPDYRNGLIRAWRAVCCNKDQSPVGS
jgi:hypothetical protein